MSVKFHNKESRPVTAKSKYAASTGYESVTSGRRTDINPYAYTHLCDHSASYQTKKKTSNTKEDWAAVTDMTGRGYVDRSSGFPGASYKKKNTDARNLDTGNRFFEDNRRIYETYVVAR